MFEHVRNWLPWNERAKRKKEFVKKLQKPHYGKRKVRFNNIKNLQQGTMIMVSNNRTGHITSAVLISSDAWAVYGSDLSSVSTKTSVDLEDFFTDMRCEVQIEDELVFTDVSGCLDVNYDGE
jgi:hypothetical protein